MTKKLKQYKEKLPIFAYMSVIILFAAYLLYNLLTQSPYPSDIARVLTLVCTAGSVSLAFFLSKFDKFRLFASIAFVLAGLFLVTDLDTFLFGNYYNINYASLNLILPMMLVPIAYSQTRYYDSPWYWPWIIAFLGFFVPLMDPSHSIVVCLLIAGAITLKALTDSFTQRPWKFIASAIVAFVVITGAVFYFDIIKDYMLSFWSASLTGGESAPLTGGWALITIRNALPSLKLFEGASYTVDGFTITELFGELNSYEFLTRAFEKGIIPALFTLCPGIVLSLHSFITAALCEKKSFAEFFGFSTGIYFLAKTLMNVFSVFFLAAPITNLPLYGSWFSSTVELSLFVLCIFISIFSIDYKQPKKVFLYSFHRFIKACADSALEKDERTLAEEEEKTNI